LIPDIEKPHIEKLSASSTNQIVPNDKLVANTIAEQQSCSAGRQHDLKVADFQGTGLTSDPTGLTGYVKKFGRVSLNNKVITKKPSFVELLQKYQKMAKQKQNNRLRDQSWNSSSPKANKRRWSS
jgi:hypothetical protein